MYIDVEWKATDDIPLGWVIIRGILYSLHFGLPTTNTSFSVLQLLECLCERAGLSVAEQDAHAWLELEAEFQLGVTGTHRSEVNVKLAPAVNRTFLSEIKRLMEDVETRQVERSKVGEELQRLRGVETMARNQAQTLTQAISDLAATRAELERLRSVEATARDQAETLTQAISDLAATRAELERLRSVEATARDQAVELTEALASLELARQEVSGLTACNLTATRRLQRLEGIEAALESQREQSNVAQRLCREQALVVQRLTCELQRLEGIEAALKSQREQSNVAQRLCREQALVVQRLTCELQRLTRELQTANQKAAEYLAAYHEACGLIVPLRLRRSLPEPLKWPFRALKRTVRSLTGTR